MARGKRRVLTTPEARRGRASRLKGSTFEREIADEFRRVYPDAKRGIGQARSSNEVADVEGTPFWVECKKRAVSVDIVGAWRQAAEASGKSPGPYRSPLVVSKVDRGVPMVSMHLEDFLALMEELGHGNRSGGNG